MKNRDRLLEEGNEECPQATVRVLGRLALWAPQQSSHPTHLSEWGTTLCLHVHYALTQTHTGTFRTPPTPTVSLIAFLTSPLRTFSSHSAVISLRQSDHLTPPHGMCVSQNDLESQLVFKSMIVYGGHPIASAETKRWCVRMKSV